MLLSVRKKNQYINMGDKKTLSDSQRALVQAAKEKAYLLYEGRVTPHRSCGIALAETFNLATPPYQSLRRGGITGMGECGAVKAGELILGEIFGDPDPTGGVTESLRQAITSYQAKIGERLDKGESPDIVCNNLTARWGDFQGEARKTFCTNLAALVAEAVAEVIVECEGTFEITGISRD